MSTVTKSAVSLVDECLYKTKFVPVQTSLKSRQVSTNAMTFEEFESMMYRFFSPTSDSPAWETSVKPEWVDRWGKTFDVRSNSMNDFFTDFTTLLHNVVNLKGFRDVVVNVVSETTKYRKSTQTKRYTDKTVVNWDRVYSQALFKFDKLMGNVGSPFNSEDVSTLRGYFSEFVMRLRNWACFTMTSSGSVKSYYAKNNSSAVSKSLMFMTDLMYSLLVNRFKVYQEVTRPSKPSKPPMSEKRKRSLRDSFETEDEAKPVQFSVERPLDVGVASGRTYKKARRQRPATV